MAVEVEPEQPEPVVAALEELLPAEPQRSAWWQAGQAEALET